MKTNKDVHIFSPVETNYSPKDLSVSIDITNTGTEMERTKYIMRYPRLDTVLMVESFIQKHDGEFKKKQLWGKLPRKMMYQTFCVVIDYLLYSGKISVDDDGKIGWIFYPEKVKQDMKLKHLFWKRPRRTVS
ncbi:MAG: hypothetical protein ABH852_02145 [Methanobacteriota archaeon]